MAIVLSPCYFIRRCLNNFIININPILLTFLIMVATIVIARIRCPNKSDIYNIIIIIMIINTMNYYSRSIDKAILLTHIALICSSSAIVILTQCLLFASCLSSLSRPLLPPPLTSQSSLLYSSPSSSLSSLLSSTFHPHH